MQCRTPFGIAIDSLSTSADSIFTSIQKWAFVDVFKTNNFVGAGGLDKNAGWLIKDKPLIVIIQEEEKMLFE